MVGLIFLFLVVDFPVTTAVLSQHYPVVQYINDQYYVFWTDLRHYSPDRSIYGARVTGNGLVIDPEGRPIIRDRAVKSAAAFGAGNFLIAVQDSC
jgi:hypothetical protein